MATFVWTGDYGTTGGHNIDLRWFGNSGATGAPVYGDADWLTTDNYWNVTTNWRERVTGGETGNTGEGGASGGDPGIPGQWYYKTASRIPAGGDTVLFQRIEGASADGLTGGNYPKSECLFGGMSGGYWHNSSAGTSTGNCNISVDSSYFTSQGSVPNNGTPLSHLRFGVSVPNGWAEASGYLGLNLHVGELIIDSEWNSSVWRNENLVVNLSGLENHAETFTMWGNGTYILKGDYITNMSVHGRHSPSNTDWYGDNRACTLTLHGLKIKEYLAIQGTHIDDFKYMPYAAQAIDGIDKVIIAPKWIGGTAGAIDIRGEITELDLYPHSGHDDYTDKPKVHLSSYHDITGLTYDAINMKEFNPFHNVLWDKDKENLQLAFNNGASAGTHVDTILKLNVEAGRFATDNLWGKLVVKGGDIQADGTLDFRDAAAGGQVEVAGISSGIDGEGLFVASSDCTILPPAGVNIAFKELTGGATASAHKGTGQPSIRRTI